MAGPTPAKSTIVDILSIAVDFKIVAA